ncbi:MAG: hypothetical protein LBH01_06685 [Verrucomicrobiales bacterium]|jgi:predicted SAM-dependent methyltransferase|nr:hypothetical protein [Verrucomicrobiales bacterium]
MGNDFASKKNSTAVVIFSFNRPRYLEQTLRSLEANSLEGLDFYLYQDGAINQFSGRTAADQSDITASIDLWNEAKLPNKHLIQKEYNVGIGIAQYEAKVFLFDEMKYDRVMFFEDDMVVSKYYVHLLQIMLAQFQDETRVGAVMCHGGVPKLFEEVEFQKLLPQVRPSFDNFWAWATWRDRWETIRPTFDKYYEFIKNVDYRKRPTNQILNFYIRQGANINVTSQDAAMCYAFVSHGYGCLNTMVHRGIYIGAVGEHMYPEKYKILGYSVIDQVDYEQDKTLDKFEGYSEGGLIEAVRTYKVSRSFATNESLKRLEHKEPVVIPELKSSNPLPIKAPSTVQQEGMKQALPRRKIAIDNSSMLQPGWQSISSKEFDLSKQDDFLRCWQKNSLETILADDVWNNLTVGQANQAARNCFDFLKTGGTLRIAVPDGNHPDPAYLADVYLESRKAGRRQRVLYNYKSLVDCLKQAGFIVNLLEYWDENRVLCTFDWESDNGKIQRSKKSIDNSKPFLNTSLIVDAIKP